MLLVGGDMMVNQKLPEARGSCLKERSIAEKSQ